MRTAGRRAIVLSGLVGLVVGIVATALAVVFVMPGMMIATEQSKYGFDETVATLKKAIKDNGWTSPGTTDMNSSMAKHGVKFEPSVKVIKLCKAKYAKDVLTTDRYVSSLMPCSIAVWKGDDGKVYVSKMNTGLMGRMFGGNIARVMGQSVAKEEHKIISSIVSR